MNSKKIFFWLAFSLALSSCGEYAVLEVQKDCKRVADSLFRAHKDSLLIKFNKECATQGPVYYQEALDSLTEARIRDIKNLIEK